MARKLRSTLSAAAFACVACASANPGFWAIAAPAGYDKAEGLTNISDGGHVVAIQAYTSSFAQMGGFRWTDSGGLTNIGQLPGGAGKTLANGVSRDGNTILGFSGNSATSWTQAGGLVDLGHLPTQTRASALRSSFNGSVIMGQSGARSFTWTQGTGMVELSMVQNGTFAQAYDISDDGTMICGTSGNINQAKGVKWVNGAIQLLADFAGSTEADAISADGSVIVGKCFNTTNQALVWKNGSVQAITPTTHESYALGVSSNGRYVVGHMGLEAFIWSEHYGLRYLAGDLGLAGVSGIPAGWTLVGASGVYEDANGELTVVGSMYGPTVGGDHPSQAFVARYTPNPVPEPTASMSLAVGVVAVLKRRRKR